MEDNIDKCKLTAVQLQEELLLRMGYQKQNKTCGLCIHYNYTPNGPRCNFIPIMSLIVESSGICNHFIEIP